MIEKLFIASASVITAMIVATFAVTQEFSSNAPGISSIVTATLMGVAAVIMAWAAMKTATQKAVAPVVEKMAKLDAEIAPIIEKVIKIDTHVAKIDTHVNSEKTHDQGVITAQKQQIELMREMINEMKKTASLLAQAKSATDLTQALVAVAGGRAPLAPVVADVQVQQEIAKNTKETADNTKKTDDTVQALKDNP